MNVHSAKASGKIREALYSVGSLPAAEAWDLFGKRGGPGGRRTGSFNRQEDIVDASLTIDGAVDLTPLEEFVRLENLELGLLGDPLPDLTPLGNLPALRKLQLGGELPSLAPLGQLTTLTELDLSGAKTPDYTFLAELIGLEVLNLQKSSITDICPLSSLTNLRKLVLAEYKDFPFLGYPIECTCLVTDFSPLAKLTALQELYISDTRIMDLAALANLEKLSVLWLGQTHVEDLAPLAELNALETLDLGGTDIVDISPLANLGSLRRLNLNRTQVKDVSPLENDLDLEELYLGRTAIMSLAPLAQLPKLQKIDLIDAEVPDLTPPHKVASRATTGFRSALWGLEELAEAAVLASAHGLWTTNTISLNPNSAARFNGLTA